MLNPTKRDESSNSVAGAGIGVSNDPNVNAAGAGRVTVQSGPPLGKNIPRTPIQSRPGGYEQLKAISSSPQVRKDMTMMQMMQATNTLQKETAKAALQILKTPTQESHGDGPGVSGLGPVTPNSINVGPTTLYPNLDNVTDPSTTEREGADLMEATESAAANSHVNSDPMISGAESREADFGLRAQNNPEDHPDRDPGVPDTGPLGSDQAFHSLEVQTDDESEHGDEAKDLFYGTANNSVPAVPWSFGDEFDSSGAKIGQALPHRNKRDRRSLARTDDDAALRVKFPLPPVREQDLLAGSGRPTLGTVDPPNAPSYMDTLRTNLRKSRADEKKADAKKAADRKAAARSAAAAKVSAASAAKKLKKNKTTAGTGGGNSAPPSQTATGSKADPQSSKNQGTPGPRSGNSGGLGDPQPNPGRSHGPGGSQPPPRSSGPGDGPSEPSDHNSDSSSSDGSSRSRERRRRRKKQKRRKRRYEDESSSEDGRRAKRARQIPVDLCKFPILGTLNDAGKLRPQPP